MCLYDDNDSVQQEEESNSDQEEEDSSIVVAWIEPMPPQFGFVFPGMDEIVQNAPELKFECYYHTNAALVERNSPESFIAVESPFLCAALLRRASTLVPLQATRYSFREGYSYFKRSTHM